MEVGAIARRRMRHVRRMLRRRRRHRTGEGGDAYGRRPGGMAAVGRPLVPIISSRRRMRVRKRDYGVVVVLAATIASSSRGIDEEGRR